MSTKIASLLGLLLLVPFLVRAGDGDDVKAHATPPAGGYGEQIQIAANASKDVIANANELASWLEKITQRKFAVVRLDDGGAVANGIVLVRADSPLVAEAQRKRVESRSNSEAYLLESTGSDRLWIVGRSDLAIQQGMYDYLDRLGCRWFLPNEHWTIIPQRPNIEIKVDALESPTDE
jgi:hypothetical protein